MVQLTAHSCSVSQHQPTVAAMATRWVEFYQEYQSFTQWAHKLDTDMSNLNPYISDLSSVRIQLEKMKVSAGVDGYSTSWCLETP